MFIYIVIYKLAPMYGMTVAFKDYSPFKGFFGSPWAEPWYRHFTRFFNYIDFNRLVRNTFYLGFWRLVCTFPAPIILALAINEVRHMKAKKIVQTISYLPHFVSIPVVVSMTIMFLNPINGAINQLIEIFGGEPYYFMSRPELYRPIYIITDIWQHTGWSSIIYLAAISAVDPQLYESAIMDGANKFRQIINITLPSIASTIVIIFIINTGNMVNIGFDKSFLLQNPLNMETADVIGVYIFKTGIREANFSYAAAVGIFNSVIALVFVVASNAVSRRLGENSLF